MKHRFEILHTWQGELLPVSEQGWIEVAIRAHTLDVCWDAPWWPEPDPDTPPGECLELCRYQAVELFLGNCGDTNYLELEFGPAGHWLILEFSSYRCLQSRHAPRFYTWERYHSTTCSRPHWARDEQPSRTRDTLRWTGRASLQGTSLLSRISQGQRTPGSPLPSRTNALLGAQRSGRGARFSSFRSFPGPRRRFPGSSMTGERPSSEGDDEESHS